MGEPLKNFKAQAALDHLRLQVWDTGLGNFEAAWGIPMCRQVCESPPQGDYTTVLDNAPGK